MITYSKKRPFVQLLDQFSGSSSSSSTGTSSCYVIEKRIEVVQTETIPVKVETATVNADSVVVRNTKEPLGKPSSAYDDNKKENAQEVNPKVDNTRECAKKSALQTNATTSRDRLKTLENNPHQHKPRKSRKPLKML